jgi:hypothetical protein
MAGVANGAAIAPANSVRRVNLVPDIAPSTFYFLWQ